MKDRVRRIILGSDSIMAQPLLPTENFRYQTNKQTIQLVYEIQQSAQNQETSDDADCFCERAKT